MPTKKSSTTTSKTKSSEETVEKPIKETKEKAPATKKKTSTVAKKTDAPKASVLTEAEVVEETPVETSVEAPKETPKEVTKESSKETPKESAKEAPKSSWRRKETLKISVKAFEHRVVDEAVKKIVGAAKDTGSQTVGPIPLPTKIEKFTLNRSTFVNKNAREQFEIRRHRRLLLIHEPTPETLDTLQKLNLPSGVGVDIEVVNK